MVVKPMTICSTNHALYATRRVVKMFMLRDSTQAAMPSGRPSNKVPGRMVGPKIEEPRIYEDRQLWVVLTTPRPASICMKYAQIWSDQ